MRYSSKKEDKEKKLNDVETDLTGTELNIGKEIQKLEQKFSVNSEKDLSNLSESEIEEKFEESEKKSVVLKFSQARELLTEKRRELLQTLSQQEFNSITELSKELGRDKKNTSQDIKKLYQNGIIDLKNQGRSKKPVFEFDKIEIEGLEFEENKENKESLENLKDKLKRDRIDSLEQRKRIEDLTEQNKELLDKID